MNPKETLFFIGKCLTINYDSENREKVIHQLLSDDINWDNIVKLSTSHYVFPALYLNLKQADLLSYLPQELVNYMEHITSLNRERNIKIIEQAKEIDQILGEQEIEVIFLKGTGLLLQGFYPDPAERMVGDIDFLVAEKDFLKAAHILEKHGYLKTEKKENVNPIFQKHYPRLYHDDKIAAVEVHLRMVKGQLTKVFNYTSCHPSILHQNGMSFLGYNDQLCLTILAKQHNDNNNYYKRSNLRSFYDVFLISQKIDFTSFSQKYSFYSKLLNPYLALSSHIMSTKLIKFNHEKSTDEYLKTALKKIENPTFGKRHDSKIDSFIFLRIKLTKLFQFFTNSAYRRYYTKKLLKR